jgi:long-chain acyl-CoA synthetase
MSEPIWQASYRKNISWDMPLECERYIDDVFDTACSTFPEQCAFEFYSRRLTFRELRGLAARIAKGLQSLDLAPRANIGLHLGNTPHYPALFFGAIYAGVRIVNCSNNLGMRELQHQISDAQISVLITLASPSVAAGIEGLLEAGTIETLIVCELGDFIDSERFRTPANDSTRPDSAKGRIIPFRALIDNDGLFRRFARAPVADEIAVIQYTGGTTGEPKGALLTHRNIVSAVSMATLFMAYCDDSSYNKGLIVLPMPHIFALCYMLATMSIGQEVVLHLRFDALNLLQDIERQRIVSFSVVPTMLAAIAGHPRAREFDLSSLRRVYVGGAPAPEHVVREFEKLTKVRPMIGYGLSETSSIATTNALAADPTLDSVGVPYPHTTVDIVDIDTGLQPVAPGQVGEICISGPQIMKGYLNNEVATAVAFRGGRFHTGDLGFIDARGLLTISDRKKDMIICGGFKVFPRNVEEVIREHPAIADVAVIGISDSMRGQCPKAFIVPRPGQRACSLSELRSFLSDRLAAYELPVALEMLEKLPTTAVGKVAKNELVQR